MDFLKDIQWANVFTAITLVSTFILGIRDANRTKAENAAKNAEANKSDSDAADIITDSALKLLAPKDRQIEQQDLQISRLLTENQQLSGKFNALEAESRATGAEHAKSISDLVCQVKALEVSNTELVRQSEEWREERGGLIQQMEALELKIRDMAKTIDSQRDQIAILIDQGGEKDRVIQKMQAELERLQKENELLQQAMRELQEENTLLKNNQARKNE